MKDCFFDFALTNWRKTQAIGLAPIYREDKKTHMLLKSFVALVLKPELDFEIRRAALCFEILDNCDDESPLLGYVGYYEST